MKYLLIENSTTQVFLISDQEPIIRSDRVILLNSEILDQNIQTCTSVAVEDDSIPETYAPRAYTYVAGIWELVGELPAVTKPTILKYVNYRITKGTGAIDPMPNSNDLIGIRNNGEDIVTITMAVMASPDINSEIYQTVSGTYGLWPISVRNSDGEIKDTIQVQFTNGQAVISYTAPATMTPGIYRFCSQRDLPRFETATTIYKFRSGAFNLLKIYREV